MPSFYRRQGLRAAPGVVAVLLVIFALLSACGGSVTQQAPPPSTPLVLQAPRGSIAFPFTFSWSGVGATDVVRVTVVDAAERQLMEFDARGISAPMPPRLSELVRPGESFSWRVAAAGETGDVSRQSEWVGCVRNRD